MSSHTRKATHFKHGYFIVSAAFFFDEEAKSPHAAAPSASGLPASDSYKTHTQKDMVERSKRVFLSSSRKVSSCIAFGLAVQSE